MTALTMILVGFGAFIGGSQGAVVFFVGAAVMNFGMFWFSDRAVLRMYRAKVVGRLEKSKPTKLRLGEACDLVREEKGDSKFFRLL